VFLVKHHPRILGQQNKLRAVFRLVRLTRNCWPNIRSLLTFFEISVHCKIWMIKYNSFPNIFAHQLVAEYCRINSGNICMWLRNEEPVWLIFIWKVARPNRTFVSPNRKFALSQPLSYGASLSDPQLINLSVI
jgi:hypothetical protein